MSFGQNDQAGRNRGSLGIPLLVTVLFLSIGWMMLAPASLTFAASDDDTEVAMRLANLLRAARSVISSNQGLINDPAIGDKGLTGEKVLADALAIYEMQTGENPGDTDPASVEGQLFRAQMDAIRTVVDENQSTINAPGVGFKGFIPAVFARLVNEAFGATVGDQAMIKVTAPENLVRNRKARPDAWEDAVITEEFLSPEWTKGQPFSAMVDVDGKPAFRILVPEYYAASCLACHGEPAGEMDITGYPKEGGKEGDLGAAISITLFK